MHSSTPRGMTGWWSTAKRGVPTRYNFRPLGDERATEAKLEVLLHNTLQDT